MTELTTSEMRMTLRHRIAASPEQVYAAWLDPAVMRKFMAAGADPFVKEARSDARVGGGFYVLMGGDKDIPHQGIYKDLTPFSRIVFTWESPYSPADSEVELLFTPVEGGTEVVLTQVRFHSEGARDGHAAGWVKILERLEAMFAG